MQFPSTTSVAIGAVSSPLWLPSLKQTSQTAADVVPILGAIWLLIQIVRALKKWPDG